MKQTKSKLINFRVSTEELDRWKKIARAQGLTLSEYIRYKLDA